MHTDEIQTVVLGDITYNGEEDEVEVATKLTRKIYFKLGSYKVKGMFDETAIGEVVTANEDLWKPGFLVRIDVLKDNTWQVLVRRHG